MTNPLSIFNILKSHKIGVPPGTLVYTGQQKVGAVHIHLIDYSDDELIETELQNFDNVKSYNKNGKMTAWVNVDGIHAVSIIEQAGKSFDLHPLITEDIVHPHQRCKIEDYGDLLFIVLKMVYNDPKTSAIFVEQVSFVLTDGMLITFQQNPTDVFDGIRERLRTHKGRIRKHGADYLAYALIDSIVDQYFVLLERAGEKIESLEEELFGKQTEQTLKDLHTLKRELTLLRKTIWPMREMLNMMLKNEYRQIQESTEIYLRDVYDHVIQIIDAIESCREIVSGMQDIYLTNISNRMNSVMKVLTIIATIFIPLGFVAGVFGMNFKNMPELEQTWAYPAGFWGLILAISFSMILYFKHKKWF